MTRRSLRCSIQQHCDLKNLAFPNSTLQPMNPNAHHVRHSSLVIVLLQTVDNCGAWSEERGVQSVDCKVQSVECQTKGCRRLQKESKGSKTLSEHTSSPRPPRVHDNPSLRSWRKTKIDRGEVRHFSVFDAMFKNAYATWIPLSCHCYPLVAHLKLCHVGKPKFMIGLLIESLRLSGFYISNLF